MPGDLPSQTPVTADSFDTSFLSTYCVPNTVGWPGKTAAMSRTELLPSAVI